MCIDLLLRTSVDVIVKKNSQDVFILSAISYATGLFTSHPRGFFSSEVKFRTERVSEVKSPVAYDTALRITMSWMTEKLHQQDAFIQQNIMFQSISVGNTTFKNKIFTTVKKLLSLSACRTRSRLVKYSSVVSGFS